MNIQRYLSRIGYIGKIENSLDALKRLQRSHVYSVAFENLDIHYGIPIDLSYDALYEKVVEQRRGGFCFELNGLFCALLHEFGFDAHLISAQVFSREGELGAPFDHAAILVRINSEDYLVDVGYGEFALEPLKINLNEPIWDERGRFIIEEYGQNQLVIARLDHARKKAEYVFDLKERQLDEFQEMCIYHQTSPNSPFTQRKLITIPSRNGRFTLTTDKFIHKIGKRTKIESIADEDHFLEKLELVFGRSFAARYSPILVRR